MRWFCIHWDDIFLENLLLRDPLVASVRRPAAVGFARSGLVVDLRTGRRAELRPLALWSALSVLSTAAVSIRGGALRRPYRFTVGLSRSTADHFLDFFFTLLLPVLRKRYSPPFFSASASGPLRLVMADLSELGLDDFFFLPLPENWRLVFCHRPVGSAGESPSPVLSDLFGSLFRLFPDPRL